MDFYSANLDQSLVNAYLKTNYLVENPPLTIKIGQKNLALDTFLKENNVQYWGFITAWNPRSEVLPKSENERLQQQLLQQLKAMGNKYLPGKGESPDGKWDAEESVLVLQLSKKEGLGLGKQFGQFAFVYGEINEAAELVWIT